MKKHLHVLLALVAFVGLVNGLGGGASGGAGGSARKTGGLVASTPKNSSAEPLIGKGSSGPSGNSSSPGPTTSVLGGGAGGGTGGGTGGSTSRSRSGSTGGTAGGSASGGTRPSVGESASGGAGAATARQTSGRGGSVTAGADTQTGGSNPAQASSTGRAGGGGGASAAAAGGPSQAESGGSSGSPGSSAPTSRPFSRDSSGAEHLGQGPDSVSSIESGNGRSGRRRGTLVLGHHGSGTSPEGGSSVRGFGLSVGGAGGGLRASADESGRLGSGLFFDGQSFGGRETGTPGFGAFGRGRSGYFESPFSDPSLGGVGGAAAGRAGGRGVLGNEELFDDEPGFSSSFAARGFPRSHETGFPTSGISNRGSGLGGDFGAESFGTDRNGGEGSFGGSAFGFGGFSSGSNGDFGSPGGDTTEFGLPDGPDGRPGPSGGSSGGENGPLPVLLTQQGPRPLPGSDNEPVGPSGWPTRENVNDFANSGLDSSRGLSSPAANGPVGPVRSGLLRRLWQRRREDPRLAAAIAAGTLVGATALGGLGAGIAAAIIASRARDAAGSGGRRRRCRAREQRINMGLKAAQEILNRIPVSLERRY